MSHTHTTVKSSAPICSRLISTMLPELILMQSHTSKQRQIHSMEYSVVFLSPSWQILHQQITLHCHTVLGWQGLVVDRLVLMFVLSWFENIPWFFFAIGGITECGSASLCSWCCFPLESKPFPRLTVEASPLNERQHIWKNKYLQQLGKYIYF